MTIEQTLRKHCNQMITLLPVIIQGLSPQESCEMVVKETQRKAGTTSKPFEMALIAINKTVAD